jgi:hypothetical protein
MISMKTSDYPIWTGKRSGPFSTAGLQGSDALYEKSEKHAGRPKKIRGMGAIPSDPAGETQTQNKAHGMPGHAGR